MTDYATVCFFVPLFCYCIHFCTLTLRSQEKERQKKRETDLNPPRVHTSCCCLLFFHCCLFNQSKHDQARVHNPPFKVVNQFCRQQTSLVYLPAFAYIHLFTGGHFMKHLPYCSYLLFPLIMTYLISIFLSVCVTQTV